MHSIPKNSLRASQESELRPTFTYETLYLKHQYAKNNFRKIVAALASKATLRRHIHILLGLNARVGNKEQCFKSILLDYLYQQKQKSHSDLHI